MRFLLSFLFIFFVSLAGFSSPVFAKTLVQDDITQNTVWTKEMSPIVVEKRIEESQKGNYEIHIINGAELTIEAGVTVIMTKSMSLNVVRDCQHAYFGDTCIPEQDGSIKYSKLIAKGTKESPIIFTSENGALNKNVNTGQWGILDLRGADNDVEYVHFSYGGAGGAKYFIQIGRNSIFKNNIVERSLIAGVYLKEGVVFESNQIKNNNGIGVYCESKCTIKFNVIKENTGDGLKIDNVDTNEVSYNFIAENKKNGIFVLGGKKQIIKNNFIYRNGEMGVLIDEAYNIPLTITNNYFLENMGGVYLYNNHPDVVVNNNNFLQNTNFAMQLKSAQFGSQITTAYNWFGTDLGSSQERGQFFVAKDINATNFMKEANVFVFPKMTIAYDEYQLFKKEKSFDEVLFEITTSNKVLSGTGQNAGSLLQYKLEAKNRKTKELSIIKIDIVIPDDQVIMACSVQIPTELYSFTDACKSSNNTALNVQNNVITWTQDFPALKQQDLYFVTLLKTEAKNTTTLLPKIDFSQGATQKNLSYSLDVPLEIYSNENVQNTAVSPIPANSPQKAPSVPVKVQKTKSIATKEQKPLVPTITAQQLFEKIKNKEILCGSDPIKNAGWLTYPQNTRKAAYALWEDFQKKQSIASTPVVSTSGNDYLEVGHVEKQVVGKIIYYFLVNDKGQKFSLYSTEKWDELNTFAKGLDKDAKIKVWGRYARNKQGQQDSIKFSRFEIVQ